MARLTSPLLFLLFVRLTASLVLGCGGEGVPLDPDAAVAPTDEDSDGVTVRGDGSVLDTRTVYFLIPPVIPPPILG